MTTYTTNLIQNFNNKLINNIKFILLSFVLVTISGLGYGQIANLHTEDFETNGEGSRYNSNAFYTDATSFYKRMQHNDSDLKYTPSGYSNSFIWVTGKVNTTSETYGEFQIDDIDISGHTDLHLKILLAGVINQYDDFDYLRIEARIDAGSFVTIGEFFDTGSEQELRQDRDLSGNDEDGSALLGNAFQDFTFQISGVGALTTGDDLDIRIITTNDSFTGQEQTSFDNIRVLGYASPIGVTNAFSATYSFETNLNVDSPPSGVTAGPISGTDITDVQTTPSYRMDDWDDTNTNSISNTETEYWSLTITPDVGSKMSLQSIYFDSFSENENNAPDNWEIRSSANSYGTVLSTQTIRKNVTYNEAIFLDGMIDLTSAVTFRIYAFSANDQQNGTHYWQVDNVQINGTVTDITGPTMQSAVRGDNTTITVTFDEPVQITANTPGDFTVVDGQGTVFLVNNLDDNVASDNMVVLTTATTAGAVGDLIVTYTDDTNEIEDFSGNSMATDATGVTIDLDTSAPTLASASLDSNTSITVTLSEPVQITSKTAGDFTVVDGQGTGFTVTVLDDGMADDNEVVLTTNTTAAVGDLTVTYTDGSNEIEDFGGNSLATNGTGVMIDRDISAPTLSSAVRDGNITITVTLSEPVQITSNTFGDFTVTDGLATDFAVSGLADGTSNDDKLILTVNNMSTAVGDLTVTYINGTSEIEDFGGNSLATNGVGVVIADNTSPIADITYDDTDGYVKAGQKVRITATFNEPIAIAPVMQLTLSGTNNQVLTDMVESSSTVYYYDHNVTAGNGPVTVALGTGTDIETNPVTSVPNSGATFQVDNTSPMVLAGTVIDLHADDDTGASDADELTKNNNNLSISGTREANTSVQLYNGGSPIGTPTGIGSGAWSIDISLIEGTHTITARETDRADNQGAVSSDLVIEVDNTPPTLGPLQIWGGISLSNPNRAYIKTVASEPLNLSHAASIISTETTGLSFYVGGGYKNVTSDDDGPWSNPAYAGDPHYVGGSDPTGTPIGTSDFNVYLDNGFVDDRDGTTLSQMIVMEAGGNGHWDSSGTPLTVTANYVNGTGNLIDLAGNEMASFSGVGASSGDNISPTITTDFVLYPNGTGNETIVFSLSEQLNLNDGDPVTTSTDGSAGFSDNIGSAFTAVYNTDGGSVRIITLTSAKPGDWNLSTIFTYNGAGNVIDASTNNNELEPITISQSGVAPLTGPQLIYETVAPTLSPISIASNNSLDAAFADVGDLITLSFTSGEEFVSSTINIAGQVVALVDNTHPTYTATYTLTSQGIDGFGAEGTIPFSIAVTDEAGNSNAASTAITTGSNVTFDKTKPNVVISSTDDDAVVKQGDDPTITVTFSDTNAIDETNPPTINIAGLVASGTLIEDSNSNTIWDFAWTVPAGMNGNYPVTVNATDVAGNAVGSYSGQTSFEVDNTAPTLTVTKNGVTNGTDGAAGMDSYTNDNSVSYTIAFDEPIDPTTFTIADIDVGQSMKSATTFDALSGGDLVNVGGSDQTYTLTIQNTALDGDLFITIGNGITDIAGNARTEGPTDSDIFIIDNTAPAISSDEITLLENGTGYEELAITMTEELILADFSSLTGISTSPVNFVGNDPLYKYKGDQNVLSAKSDQDGDFTVATTVNFTNDGSVTDLAGNALADFSPHTVIINEVTLSAGDIMFTGYNSATASTDGFSFVLLTDLISGTKIKFTDRGWSGSAFVPIHNSGVIESNMEWTSTTDLFAGTEVSILSSTGAASTGTTSGTLNLSASYGDQVLAYQGSNFSPTFISGIQMDNEASNYEASTGWNENTTAINFDDERSLLPFGLTGVFAAPTNNNQMTFGNLLGSATDAQYNGITTAATVALLRTALANPANWNKQTGNYALTSGNNFKLMPDVTTLTPVHNASIKVDYGTLQITFDDNITKDLAFNGDITINVSGGATVLTYNVNDSKITIAANIVSIDISGDLGSLVNETDYEVNVDGFMFVNSDGLHNIPIVGATEWTFTYDSDVPDITSIERADTNPTSSTSIDYTVTFDQSVSGVDVGDFTLNHSASSTGAVIATVSPAGPASIYTVTVNNINLLDASINSTLLRLDLADDNTILDDALNLFGGNGIQNYSSGAAYEIVHREPNGPVQSFVLDGTKTTTSITLEWQDPTPASPQVPNQYVIIASTTSSAALPVDGDFDLSDNGYFSYKYVNYQQAGVYQVSTPSTYTYTYTGLNSASTYYFQIIPLTNNSTNTDYNPSSVPEVFDATAAASTAVITSFIGNTTVPSTADTQVEGVTVLTFTIADDAAMPFLEDNTPTLINQIVLNRETDNGFDDMGNWDDVLAGAELYHNGSGTLEIGAISANAITFSSIPNGSNADLGYITSEGSKTYTLRIWLNSNLGGSLPATIDGLNMVFDLDESDISVEGSGSSVFHTNATLNSGQNNNKVVVVASELRYLSNVPVDVAVGTNYPVLPQVEATDELGNRDLNYVGALSITNTGTDGGDGMLEMSNENASTLSNGVFTFHTDFSFEEAGTDVTLIANTAGLASDSHGTIDVSISNATTITAGTAASEITSIATNDAAILGVDADAAALVYDFTITDDDGLVNPGDIAVNDTIPTQISGLIIKKGGSNDAFNWSDAIYKAAITYNGVDFLEPTSITNDQLIFTGIPSSVATDMGHVADGTARNYELYILLKGTMTNPYGGTLIDDIDNLKFDFRLMDDDISLVSNSSTFTSSEDVSTSGIPVEVIATQLTFDPMYTGTQQPDAVANYGTTLSTRPIATARDIHFTLDKDYGNSPLNQTVAVTNADGLADSNDNVSYSNGEVRLSTSFVYNLDGANGADGTLTFTDNATPSITATTTAITVNYSGDSDIIRDATFNANTDTGYFSNIDYSKYQGAVDITGNSNSIVLEGFTLRDGGSGNDSDGTPTTVTEITVQISNWENLRRIELYDEAGTTALASSATNEQNVTGEFITFTGLTLIAQDTETPADDYVDFTIRASFLDNPVDDNEQISFIITNVETLMTGSQLLNDDGSTAGDIKPQSDLPVDKNRIEVIAIDINFTQNFFAASLDTNLPATQPIMEAQDANLNTDTDFTLPINTFTVSDPGVGLTLSPVSSSFTSGVFDFTTDAVGFQFTDNGSVSTTVNATTSAAGVYGAFSVTSDPFAITAAEASIVTLDAATPNAASFDYILYDDDFADFGTTGNYYTLANYLILDEDVVPTFMLGVDPNDLAPTQLSGLEINITNNENIKDIALFDGVNYYQGVAGTLGDFAFSGFNISVADLQTGGGATGIGNFSIVASFNSTFHDSENDDDEELQVTIVSTTDAGGSKFDDTDNDNLNGNDAGGDGAAAVTASLTNIYNVKASEFIFVQQPSAIEGIGIPWLADPLTPLVRAQDANGGLDQGYLDTNYSIDAPSGLNTTTVPAFDNGYLDLANLNYSNTGVGTLTMTDVSFVIQQDWQSTHVDVINTIGTQLFDGIEENIDPIVSGKENVAILGFSLSSAFNNGSDPRFNELRVQFVDPDDQVTPVDVLETYTNFRLFESFDDSIDPTFTNTTNITVGSALLSNGNSTVTFSGIDIDIDNDLDDQYYFLVVDVSVNADDKTDPVVALIIDNEITMSAGSFQVTAPIVGKVYEFDDRKKPELDPSQFLPLDNETSAELITNFILAFDEAVVYGDETVELFKQNPADGELPVLLKFTGDNGEKKLIFQLWGDHDDDPITPDVQIPLEAETDYYINVGDNSIRDGEISDLDEESNFFDGISDNLTWNFRSKDTTPPKWTPGITINNQIDKNISFSVELDEISIISWFVVPQGTNVDSYDFFNAGGEAAIIDAGALNYNVPEQLITHYITDLTIGNDYDLYVIAKDDDDNAQFVDLDALDGNPIDNNVTLSGGIGYMTTTFSPKSNDIASGPTVVQSETSVCVGVSQPQLSPLFIIEELPHEFTSSTKAEILLTIEPDINPETNVTYDISFDDASIPVFGSGTTPALMGSPLVYNFINNNLLRLIIDIGASDPQLDVLVLEGIKFITPNDNATGKVINVSTDDAFPNDPSDFYVNLESYDVAVADFEFSPSETAVADDANAVLLVPDASLLGGTNIFSGNGVSEVNNNYFFNPGAVATATHEVTLDHSNEIGCLSTTFKQMTVYEAQDAISGVNSKYCVDNTLTFNLDDPRTYERIEKTEQENFVMDTLFVNYKVTGLVNINENGKDVQYSQAYFNELDPSEVLMKVDSTGDYILNLVAVSQLLNQDIQAIELQGDFRSIFNSATIIPLVKQVRFSESPTINSFSIQSISSFSGSEFDYCEDDVEIRLSADIDIDNDFNELRTEIIRMVSDTSSTSIPSYVAIDNFGSLTDGGAGAATINTQTLHDALGTDQYGFQYIFVNDSTGCSSDSTLFVTVNAKPVADFRVQDRGDLIEGCVFESGINPDSVTFISNPYSSILSGNTISEWNWTFDDADNSDPSGANTNTSTSENPSHKYKVAGSYNVDLIVKSTIGCTSLLSEQVLTIGNNPTPQFTYNSIGQREGTEFKIDGTQAALNILEANISTVEWSFDERDGKGYMAEAPLTTDFFDFSYPFEGNGVKDVRLTITSDLNCNTTITDSLFIVPLETLVDGENYTAFFEDDSDGWVTWGTNNSWQLDNSGGDAITGSSITNPGSQFWVTSGGTHANGNASSYNENEESYVYSPIFDFTAMTRPLFKFDIFDNMSAGNDGVVIEYSITGFGTDPASDNWEILGKIGTGINWYEDRDIADAPGRENDINRGWSSEDDDWRTARNTLSVVSLAPRVQFRVSFKSGDNGINHSADGFAFDNVFIGQRTRTVLVENFTNTFEDKVDDLNRKIVAYESAWLDTAFVSGNNKGIEVIKLNYHTDYPGEDPINIMNPSDHGARAAYYNISGIPQAVLDGDSTLTDYFSTWGQNAFDQRSLSLAEFEIDLAATVVESVVKIDLSMTSLEDKEESNDIILNIAIVEKDVEVSGVNSGETTVYNVVRDLLPNAAGTIISNNEVLTANNAGQPFTRSFTWVPNNEFDTEDLKVVAFLQDAITKTVYQSVNVDIAPITSNNVVTYINDLKETGFSLYPNPATDRATISFGKALNEVHTVKVFDRFGKLLIEKVVGLGAKQLYLETQDYINGLYLIQVESNSSVIDHKKLIIMKD